MAEPPPSNPREPADDETVIVPPDRGVEETVISDGWGPESEVFTAEETVVEETVPPRKPLLWPWLLALLVAVLAGIGAYLYFTQQDETTVPAVTGMRQEPAEAAVRDAGLEPESTQQQSSKPAGIVLGQSPDAGAEVDEGSSVRLAVSTGPPRETVPDVVGQTRTEAVDALAAAGFETEVAEAFSDKKAGIVVSQDPKAGAAARRRRHGRPDGVEGRQAGDRARRRRHPFVGGDREAPGRRAEGQRRRRTLERGGRDRGRAEPRGRQGRARG